MREAAATRRRPLALIAFLLLVVAPLLAVAIISTFLFRPAAGFLEFELEASGGTAAQLFWTSTWAFTQENSALVPLHQHPGGARSAALSAAVPAAGVLALRSPRRPR